MWMHTDSQYNVHSGRYTWYCIVTWVNGARYFAHLTDAVLSCSQEVDHRLHLLARDIKFTHFYTRKHHNINAHHELWPSGAQVQIKDPKVPKTDRIHIQSIFFVC